jgi:hypothetical protein
MNKFYLLLALALAGPAQAAVNCYTDGYGNQTCTGSDGYHSNTYTDNYGNSTGRDNRGNTWNCYTDGYGNTTCN